MSKQTYDAEKIEVLKGLDPVRQNPGMWIGGTDDRGRHHLLWEVVDNAVDEHLAGFGEKISIVIHQDGSATVIDEGRGIPIDKHANENKSAVEVVMTTLHAGGKFNHGAYKVSGGLHGVGLSVVNALSEWTEVKVRRNGQEYQQRYEKGVPKNSLKKIRGVKAKTTGTTITFKPDPEMFEKSGFDIDVVERRLHQICYLEQGLSVALKDEKSGEEELISHPGGIVDYIVDINKEKENVFPKKPIVFDGNIDETQVRISFQYSSQAGEITTSFANIIPTSEGGHHVTGFRSGLTRALNSWARRENILKDKDANLEGGDVRDGLTAIISVKMRAPMFEGQTKTRLGNPEIEAVVSQIVNDAMSSFLDTKPQVGRMIVKQAQMAREAREQARAAADSVRKKRPVEALPAKLADCSSKTRAERELYICEGDSAAGSAKQARNPKTQAVLPIRGKVLNVEKVRLAKGLKNEEIRAMLATIGTGLVNGNDENAFDIDGLRYERIIIMTDADVDGQHIQMLLLTMLFRYMRPLIEEGHVYVARPPLYRVDVGKDKRLYARTEAELKAILKTRPSSNVSRFKGLGEMRAKDLAETAMNIDTRDVAKVSVESMVEADKLFSELMGSKVEPRKKFLEHHSLVDDKIYDM